MRKLALAFFLASVSLAEPPLDVRTSCPEEYLSGFQDAITSIDKLNAKEPGKPYWVVIDVSNFPKKDVYLLGWYAHLEGYNPFFFRAVDADYLLVDSFERKGDAEYVVRRLSKRGIRAEVIPKSSFKVIKPYRLKADANVLAINKYDFLSLIQEAIWKIEFLDELSETEKARLKKDLTIIMLMVKNAKVFDAPYTGYYPESRKIK